MYRFHVPSCVSALLFLSLSAASVLPHGDLDERIASATEQIHLAPPTADLYVQRAELHRLHEDFEASRADLQSARQLEPELPRLALTQARLEQDLQRPDAALGLTERLLTERPLPQELRLEVLLLHAQLLTHMKQTERAILAWTQLCHAHPQPAPDWYLQRASLQAPEPALAGIDQALRRLGSSVALVLHASALEEALGRTDAACARLQPLLKASPRKETWLSRQGDILHRAGLHARALAKFQEARVQLQLLPSRHRNTFSMQRLARHLDQAIAALTP